MQHFGEVIQEAFIAKVEAIQIWQKVQTFVLFIIVVLSRLGLKL